MSESEFQRRIEEYDRWKSELIAAVTDFEDWLESQEADTGEYMLPILSALDALRNDRLNIAFVAEFSRGKTELINAVFFADYGRRLLPSEAGRTTMCPTELFYDAKADAAYVRLLPIETRLEETSIAEYKEEPMHWTHIPLDLQQPEQMQEALREIVRTKRVTAKEAQRLGLYSEDIYCGQNGESPAEDTEVEIPMWRHALISFPHPMLKQGLVILDTPGLNALGSEPELTMHMLPSAQAVLFVLAADTGVTRSDLDVWQHHIAGTEHKRAERGLAVVLNKVDTLWDDLKEGSAVETSIDTQVKTTAQQLGVSHDHVFPVSAQKGLLAKVRGDRDLLERSRLESVEDYLCNTVLPGRESILRDHIVHSLSSLLDEHYQLLDTRNNNVNSQLNELRGLSGKNADVIMHLMKKTREEQTAYQKNLESFQASHRLMKRQTDTLVDALNVEPIDELINSTRKSMTGSWTTSGLQKAMKSFFAAATNSMEQAVEQAEQTHKLVLAVYKKFHVEHGLPPTNPRVFTIREYYRQVKELHEEAEAFRKSPVTAMMEQNFLIKKFFIDLVSRVRNVFFKAQRDAQTWSNVVMNPLKAQISEHKQTMERRLKTLRKINDSRETLDTKISELESEAEQLGTQLARLEDIRKRVLRPLPYEASSAA